MVLDLGPCPADEALSWSKFARRIVVELRTSADVEAMGSSALIDSWAETIDTWSDVASRCRAADQPFRLVHELEPERAEFLLAGLDRSLHSPLVRSLCTNEEIDRQRPFTIMVIRSFLDGLTSEGAGCQEYADHIVTSLQGLLPD